MDAERQLYKLRPFVSQKVWGYEQWIVSAMEGRASLFEREGQSAPLQDLVGSSFPLLVKLIQANQTLSVQVHPDDSYAKIHENSNGKTECWYILEAESESAIISGVRPECTREKLAAAVQSGTLEEWLVKTRVKKGDFIFIPAGTVHAIMGGLRILEVQQASDVTYRLYDWGRQREMHVQKSLDVMKSVASAPVHDFAGKFACDYFALEKLDVRGKAALEPNPHGWTSIIVVEGGGTVSTAGGGTVSTAGGGESIGVEKESTLIAAPNSRIALSGEMRVFVVQAASGN